VEDPRQRFTHTAELYDRWRPTYPSALVDWLIEACGLTAGAAIADVGCGTGISARLFSERGFRVTGIDPNEAMLAKALARGGADFRRGESHATGLPDASQSLVFAAQAFHWFEVPPTLAEWKRVLAPGGRGAVFWNDRTHDTDLLRAYETLLVESSTEYREVSRKYDVLSVLRGSPLVKDWAESEFPSSQSLDREGFLGRVFSSSYVVHGVDDKDSFTRELEHLFDTHAEGGRVEIRYRAIAACWRPA
jgi:ubiquinone/menaquinone biosynthesis C-methylase UbiE